MTPYEAMSLEELKKLVADMDIIRHELEKKEAQEKKLYFGVLLRKVEKLYDYLAEHELHVYYWEDGRKVYPFSKMAGEILHYDRQDDDE